MASIGEIITKDFDISAEVKEEIKERLYEDCGDEAGVRHCHVQRYGTMDDALTVYRRVMTDLNELAPSMVPPFSIGAYFYLVFHASGGSHAKLMNVIPRDVLFERDETSQKRLLLTDTYRHDIIMNLLIAVCKMMQNSNGIRCDIKWKLIEFSRDEAGKLTTKFMGFTLGEQDDIPKIQIELKSILTQINELALGNIGRDAQTKKAKGKEVSIASLQITKTEAALVEFDSFIKYLDRFDMSNASAFDRCLIFWTHEKREFFIMKFHEELNNLLGAGGQLARTKVNNVFGVDWLVKLKSRRVLKLFYDDHVAFCNTRGITLNTTDVLEVVRNLYVHVNAKRSSLNKEGKENVDTIALVTQMMELFPNHINDLVEILLDPGVSFPNMNEFLPY